MIYKREITEQITPFLLTDDIIVLHGARQVGKTHILYDLKNTLEQQDHQVFYFDLEDSRITAICNTGTDAFLQLLKEQGALFGEKKVFVCIDEIQYLKQPSPFLKLLADHHKEVKLIVSGSSSFEIKKKFSDSLVGRTIQFEIFPLSFYEFLRFKDFSFPQTILKQKTGLTTVTEDQLFQHFLEFVRFGGYPKIVLEQEIAKKEQYLQQIIDTYIAKDIRDIGNIRSIDTFNKLLEILAYQSGNLLNVTELANTCKLAKVTVEQYLFLLEETYIIKRIRPISGNIRNELFKTPKVFFYDTGIQQLLSAKQLLTVPTGAVLETAIFAELVKKYGRKSVYFWRTQNLKEIDFVIRQANTMIPIEVKTKVKSGNEKHLQFFMDHYELKAGYITGLEQKKESPYFCYPWAL